MTTRPITNINTRQLTRTVLLAGLAIALAPLSLPLGPVKVFPAQHMVNVVAAALVGPWWGLAAAFLTSLIRNMLGLGTLFAFPGSMIGVVVAGVLFRLTRTRWSLWLGEVIGSGMIGATLAALMIAPLLDTPATIWGMVGLFLPSVLIGASLGLLGVASLRRAGLLHAD